MVYGLVVGNGLLGSRTSNGGGNVAFPIAYVSEHVPNASWSLRVYVLHMLTMVVLPTLLVDGLGVSDNLIEHSVDGGRCDGVGVSLVPEVSSRVDTEVVLSINGDVFDMAGDELVAELVSKARPSISMTAVWVRFVDVP